MIQARCVFFFFIGGVQPKTVTLQDAPRLCPSCGLNTCRRLRQDYYLSLFFIPLFRVKSGQAFWLCRQCGQACDGHGRTPAPYQPAAPPQASAAPGSQACRFCGKPLSGDFSYCPYCGARI